MPENYNTASSVTWMGALAGSGGGTRTGEEAGAEITGTNDAIGTAVGSN